MPAADGPEGEGIGAGRPSKPARALEGGLYLTAVPIGNARDITLRALDVLAAADVVAAEDTRATRRLLAIHGIARPLVAYHEHNAERARPALLARLAAGGSVALVPEAGMPLISDPGYKLVREARGAGIRVTSVPGPSASLAALAVSGIPSDRFLFAGFAPPKAAARRALLAELAAVPASLVFFESPRRLAASLADMAAVLGPRPAAVTRELTKLFEEVRGGTLAELAAHYGAAGPPRGEVAVVVGPPLVGAPPADDALAEAIAAALEHSSLRDAAAEVAAATGLPRRQVYQRAVALLAAREKP
jgi:16S rRNA (cytidine1402-2'-O)-methyltransferase